MSSSPAPVPFDAPAIERGVGFFETVLLIGRRAVLWERHLARVLATLERYEFPAPQRQAFDRSATEAIDRAGAGPEERALRLSYIAVGHDLDSPKSWRLDLSVRTIPEATLERRQGARVITLPEELSRDTPGVKSTSYFAAIAGLRIARRSGATEALFQTREKTLLEGTSTGLLVFSSDGYRTAGRSMLPSVTTRLFLAGRGTAAILTAVDVRQGAMLLGSLTKAAPIISLDGVACEQPSAMLDDIHAFNERISSDATLGSVL